MSNHFTVRDPIEGHPVTFIGADAKKLASLHLRVAAAYLVTIKEVYRMARLAVLGPVLDDDDEFDPVDELQGEIEQDRDLLKFELPLDEMFQIWQRSHDCVEVLIAHCTDPAKRSEMERRLAEREAAMEKLRARAWAMRGRAHG